MWVPPVRNRLDMLATGIKSPVGIKVNGNNIADIERVARQIEQVVKDVPRRLLCAGGASGRRTLRGYSYRSAKAARYGVSVDELQSPVSTLVGGDNIGEVIQDASGIPSTCVIPAICVITSTRCGCCR